MCFKAVCISKLEDKLNRAVARSVTHLCLQVAGRRPVNSWFVEPILQRHVQRSSFSPSRWRSAAGGPPASPASFVEAIIQWNFFNFFFGSVACDRFKDRLKSSRPFVLLQLAVRCTHKESHVEVAASDFKAVTGPCKGLTNTSASIEMLADHSMIISCSNGLQVHVKRLRFHRMSFFNVRVSTLPGIGATRGVLGTLGNFSNGQLDGRHGEKFILADKKSHYVGHTVAEIDHFQESWRVNEKERLFVRELEASPPVSVRGESGLGTMQRKGALAACVAAGVTGEELLEMCVYDAIATGSLDHVASFMEDVFV